MLEEYWSNDEKVQFETQKKLAHADELEGRGFYTAGVDEPYDSVKVYLDEQNRAHTAWARQVTSGDPAVALGRLNRRRELLAAHWQRVIEEARSHYRGKLTYAANFDQYQAVGFWSELDLIGINAYFPLRERWQPNLDETGLAEALAEGWRGVLGNIDRFRNERGLPGHRVLFTELGYVRRKNSTIRPWAAEGFAVLESDAGDELVLWQDQPADLDERALALAALHAEHLAVGGDLLTGLLYWKFSTEPAHEEIEPFVITLGGRPRDPALPVLARFTEAGR